MVHGINNRKILWHRGVAAFNIPKVDFVPATGKASGMTRCIILESCVLESF